MHPAPVSIMRQYGKEEKNSLQASMDHGFPSHDLFPFKDIAPLSTWFAFKLRKLWKYTETGAPIRSIPDNPVKRRTSQKHLENLSAVMNEMQKQNWWCVLMYTPMNQESRSCSAKRWGSDNQLNLEQINLNIFTQLKSILYPEKKTYTLADEY